MSATTVHSPRDFERKEDAVLLELVRTCGTDQWNTVSAAMGNRTARQCRSRDTQFLAPGVTNSPRTPDEDDLLKKQYNDIGPKWAALRQFFPGRTDLNVKNRFGHLARGHPDTRDLRAKFVGDDEPAKPPKRRAGDIRLEPGVPVTFDAPFQSLPCYMKRCLLLEAVLSARHVPVPPAGVCDPWIDDGITLDVEVEQVSVDGDPLPQIHEADQRDKQWPSCVPKPDRRAF
jgi:hypothetical protein